jgi:hypothetical protein
MVGEEENRSQDVEKNRGGCGEERGGGGRRTGEENRV